MINSSKTIFLFDLDGTLTRTETLPLIATHCHLGDTLERLTHATIKGHVPFVESFIRRVSILGEQPIQRIQHILSNVPLFEGLRGFINTHSDQCMIVTANLDCWIQPFRSQFNCSFISSEARIDGDKVIGFKSIVKKGDIVRDLKQAGFFVVFVGEGNNDAEAMRLADIAVASGMVHIPAQTATEAANYTIFDERAMLRLLRSIASQEKPASEKTIVITAAGIGSRLGLGSTKALLNVKGAPLVQYLLPLFEKFEDVRLVVGFDARTLMQAVLEIRSDIIFVWNHDYFRTGAGRSLYLGSRFGADLIVAWDADLIVHHSYWFQCLTGETEYLGVTPVCSSDPVYAHLDEAGLLVVSIDRERHSSYEWSGPAQLNRNRIANTSGDVFAGLREHLPMRAMVIRALDIDTEADYENASKVIEEFYRVE